MNYKQKIIEEDEYQKLFELINSNKERLKRYFPNTIKEISTEEKAKSHLQETKVKQLKREKFLFGIYSANSLIGYINVKNIDWEIPKCELGYFIDKSYEGKGIMTQQISEALKYCFENLEMKKVFLRIGTENTGSIILAEKNGFEKEGILRKEFRIETGELIDVVYYGKIKTELK